MGKRPKVSVVVPTYNRHTLLQRCLEGVLNQKYDDYDLYISDNASTDGTEEYCRSLTDPRVTYHRNETNVGPFVNMNEAALQAEGEYVCILHDDDVYDPEYLNELTRILDENPSVGMVHCSVRELDPQGKEIRVVKAYPETHVAPSEEAYARFTQGHNVCCSTVMMRRTILQDIGAFSLDYLTADFYLWLQFAMVADVAYVAKPLVGMRVHEATVTGMMTPKRWYDEFVEILDRSMAQAEKLHPHLIERHDELWRIAAKAQSRRFLIAALSASAQGEYAIAREYGHYAGEFQKRNSTGWYTWLSRAFSNPVGGRVLSAARRLRRRYKKELLYS